MGNALRVLYGRCCKSTTAEDSDYLGPHGVSAATVGVSALARGLFHFEITAQVPEGLSKHVVSSKKAQANWVDAKAVPDGDTISVYVSTAEPRELSCVPRDVQMAAIQRSKARARNYEKADALQKKIVDSGYRVINVQNEEILAPKY